MTDLTRQQQQEALEALPKGPDFIDTAGCICSLQAVNVQEVEDSNNWASEAWRCTNQQNKDTPANQYDGASGQWFMTANAPDSNGLDFAQNETWDGNPPKLDTAYLLQGPDNRQNGSLVVYNSESPDGLSADDQQCTGQNSSEASTAWYTSVQDNLQKNGQLLRDTCALRGSVAIELGNVTFYNKNGCPLGFLCTNTSAIQIPQFCPPLPICQLFRLNTGNCPPQGYFEPVICNQGSYCPPGGKLSLPCPEGFFCPFGTYQPNKCSVGARCPQGSYFNMSFVPLALLIILDVFMVIALIFWKLRQYLNKRRLSNRPPKGILRRAGTLIEMTKRNNQAYEFLDDDDHSLRHHPMAEARITSFKRTGTGFMAAMEPDFVYDEGFVEDDKPSSELQLFVHSLSKCMDTTKFGLSFEFENLEFKPRKADKPILSEVTGRIPYGTFCAVMGGSGAGKSTFVNVLMGKQSHTGGITKVNGLPSKISKYKKIIGYVPQDDIVLPELTVRENILHSARIRLPASWKASEIERHVDVLLSCLQLSHVKDSLVGSPAKPVISGGQRKRVSIGMELAAAPMALFLDEPTSGLDATSASSIMSLLKALSRIGITIVAIIHQPRQEIYESLDEVILLGRGRMLFQGNREGVQTYFEQLGFVFPEHGNPADVLMDIIAGQGQNYKKVGETGIQALIENWKNTETAQHLRRPSSISTLSHKDMSALRRSMRHRGAYWWGQIYYCLMRSILQQWRMKSSFLFEMATASLAGFLGGLTENSNHGNIFIGNFFEPYLTLGSATNYSAVPQMSLLIGLSIGLIAASPGVKVFGEEKLMYWREAAAGHNKFAYYIGKVVSVLPRIFLAAIHFTVFFQLLATPLISWGNSFFANLLYFYTIYGLASIVSMIFRREDGPLLAVLAGLIVGFLNGMSPSLRQVFEWHMGWLWQATPGTWLAEAYFTENVTPLAYLYKIQNASDAAGYTLNRFKFDMLILFVLGTTYRVLAFFGLILFKRSKQR